MRVPVVMVFVATRLTGKLFDGNNAAMKLRAIFMLELDGGVGDVEVLAQHVVEIDEDAVALRGRNVCDSDMAGQGAGLRAEAPHMKVVHVDDAFNSLHAGANLRSEQSRGVPSSRIFRVSRTMP